MNRESRRPGSNIARRRIGPAGAKSTAVHPGFEGGQYAPLKTRDIERIYDTALKLLEEVGIGDPIPEILKYAIPGGCILGDDGRLRYRYCKSAVVTAWSVMASAPPPPARVPTLLLLGAESWLTLDEQAEAYRVALGDLLEVVSVPGGHTVYWDALDETAAALEAFLAAERP